MSDFMNKLYEISELKDGWDKSGECKAFSKLLIERCERMAKQMNSLTEIRPTIDGCICFDFDNDVIDMEICVYDNEIQGFVSNPVEDASLFTFETETDAVNFWNNIVALYKQTL